MKLIHTSDWHIGQSLYRFERDEEHRYFFDRLAEVLKSERPDVLLVSGDVYHNAAPSATSVKLFVDGVIHLHKASPETEIFITAGNHDSASRLESEGMLWKLARVHIVGSLKRNEQGQFDPMQFIFPVEGKGFIIPIPFIHPLNIPLLQQDDTVEQQRSKVNAMHQMVLDKVAELNKDSLPVVMMAHLTLEDSDTRAHTDNTEQVIGNLSANSQEDMGEGYDYLALGHIHKPQQLDERICYSGSAIPVSFSESFPHGVYVVEIERHGQTPSVTLKEIPSLRKVISIPENGAPLEEALELFQNFDPKDNSYVRILVDQDEPMAPNADTRANIIAEGKECRFCGCFTVPKKKFRVHADETFDIQGIEELQRLDPMEIALKAYQRENDGAQMNDTLRSMLQMAIDNVTKRGIE